MGTALTSIVLIIVAAIVTGHDSFELRRRWKHAASTRQKIIILTRFILLWIAVIASLLNAWFNYRDYNRMEGEIELLSKTPAITQEQHDKFLACLTGAETGEVPVWVTTPSIATTNYAHQIRRMLDDAGYKISGNGIRSMIGISLESRDSNDSFNSAVYIISPSEHDEGLPSYAYSLKRAFLEIGIKVEAIPYPKAYARDLSQGHIAILVVDMK